MSGLGVVGLKNAAVGHKATDAPEGIGEVAQKQIEQKTEHDAESCDTCSERKKARLRARAEFFRRLGVGGPFMTPGLLAAITVVGTDDYLYGVFGLKPGMGMD